MLLTPVLVIALSLAAYSGGDSPDTGGEGGATPRPEATEQPQATGEPKATSRPGATEVPAATKEPKATEQPGVAAEPEATEKPEVTLEPEATEESSGAMPTPSGDGSRAKVGYTSVSAGVLHTCGVMTDGAVACWGYGPNGQGTPPEGKFASVSAGGIHTCGVMTDGAVACWGSNEDGVGNLVGQATPPWSVGGRVRMFLVECTAKRHRRRVSSPASTPGGFTPAE